MASKQINRNVASATTDVVGHNPDLEFLLRALKIMKQNPNMKKFMETHTEGVSSAGIPSESCPNEIDILIRKQFQKDVYYKVTKHQCAKCVQAPGLPTGDKWFLEVLPQNSAANKVENQSMNKVASSVGIEKQQMRQNLPGRQTSFGNGAAMQNQNMCRPLNLGVQNLPDPKTSLGNMAAMQKQKMSEALVISNYNTETPAVLKKSLVTKQSMTKSRSLSELILTSAEELELIELVRQHPLFYDFRHRQYKDREVQDCIWRLIAKQVGKPAKVCKQHWENLRDEYKRGTAETKMGTALVSQVKSSERNVNELLSFLDYQKRLVVKYNPKFDATQEIISGCDRIDPNNEQQSRRTASSINTNYYHTSEQVEEELQTYGDGDGKEAYKSGNDSQEPQSHTANGTNILPRGKEETSFPMNRESVSQNLSPRRRSGVNVKGVIDVCFKNVVVMTPEQVEEIKTKIYNEVMREEIITDEPYPSTADENQSTTRKIYPITFVAGFLIGLFSFIFIFLIIMFFKL